MGAFGATVGLGRASGCWGWQEVEWWGGHLPRCHLLGVGAFTYQVSRVLDLAIGIGLKESKSHYQVIAQTGMLQNWPRCIF